MGKYTRMNYELAKELREAGFPFGRGGGHIDEETDSYFFPTLSELIEACGEDFDSLSQTKGEKWETWGSYYCCDEHGEGKKICYGDSPEEAVAMLWLSLNKKSV